MPFTNLNRRLDNSSRSYRSIRPKKSKKKLFFKLFVILVILVLAIYLPIRGVYSSVKKFNVAAKGISAAAKSENLDEIRSNLRSMQQANNSLSTNLNFLFWAAFIPYFGGYYSDARHFSKAGQYELEAVTTIADSLDPYKNELGFTGQPTPGQDRVTQAVKILEKTVPNLDKIAPLMQKASAEVDSVDVSKYPEKFGNKNVRSLIDTAKNFIQGASYAITEARPAIEAAPAALGSDSPKNYLIIFQNDKELRATGGFMTAYTFMKIDKGHLSSTTSDDIYRLDEKLLNVCLHVICPLTPPAPIAKYLPEANGKPRTAWSMRDSNLSPDVPTSMKTFENMYSYLKDQPQFDGIILIDTHVVEELIKITGPIEVFGTTFSADKDQRCNCPNVIYGLEDYAQVIEKGENDRKAILGTLMQQILARSLGASTDKLPEFINAGVKLANAKHILMYMHDQKTQQALSQINWTGEINQAFQGDYLHVNDSNFAGGKSNLYIQEEVTVNIDPKTAHHKVEMKYSNPQPYNTWLNGINRDYVRLYVPQGAKLTSSKGSDVPVTTIEKELGKTVFEAFIQVRPQNSRILTVEYDLPNPISGRPYPFLIQKQPGTPDFKYNIKFSNQSKSQFVLDMDKDLKIPI